MITCTRLVAIGVQADKQLIQQVELPAQAHICWQLVLWKRRLDAVRMQAAAHWTCVTCSRVVRSKSSYLCISAAGGVGLLYTAMHHIGSHDANLMVGWLHMLRSSMTLLLMAIVRLGAAASPSAVSCCFTMLNSACWYGDGMQRTRCSTCRYHVWCCCAC